MTVLRTLSGGILAADAAAQSEFMSAGACSEFFKVKVVRTLNPADGAADEEHDGIQYTPTLHAADEDFIPLHVNFEEGEELSEQDAFHRLQLLLANHLHYTYQRGELQWPKTRTEINDMYNILPHEHFPNINDLHI
jgi:hypothetical protein